MKKISLLLMLGLVSLLGGCTKDQSLSEVAYNVSMNDLSEEDLSLVDLGTYSKSFVLANIVDVAKWIEDNSNSVSDTLVEDLSDYEEEYFEDNLIVIVYITNRAYSSDFCIRNQEFKDNVLSIEVQYYVPWYAFGDSWSEVFAIVIELTKGDTDDISVEVTYVER